LYVFDDEKERLGRRHILQATGHSRQEPLSPRLWSTFPSSRKWATSIAFVEKGLRQSGKIDAESLRQLLEGKIGRNPGHVVAVSPRHAYGPRFCPPGELSNQRRLADACLAADKKRSAPHTTLVERFL
jgi:hypothetical protein